MKQEYIRIITAELGKLDEDQLYKVLVLTKNTSESNARKGPSKNRSLLNNIAVVSDKLLLPASIAATDNLKKILQQLGLTQGYGIISVVGKNSDNSGRLSSYVCFCIPDKADGLVEIKEVSRGEITYHLSYKDVGATAVSSMNLHGSEQLVQALESVVKKYKN